MKARIRNRRLRLPAGIAVALATGMLAVGQIAIAAGPPTIDLLTAEPFAVLAGAGITNTGPTTITGDVGSYPTITQTGFGSVTLNGTNHAGDAVTQGAKTDLITAYNTAAAAGPTIPVVADLGGQNLAPGVYNSASSLGLTGALTLSGGSTDTWIFQAGSMLTTASGSSVVFSGGAGPCNVFWQIGSSATIGTGSAFAGTIMALESITVTTGATIAGRALARNGAVTLDTNTITRPTCSTAPGAPASGAPGPSVTDVAMSGPGRGNPLATVVVALGLTALLAALATATVRTARQRR